MGAVTMELSILTTTVLKEQLVRPTFAQRCVVMERPTMPRVQGGVTMATTCLGTAVTLSATLKRATNAPTQTETSLLAERHVEMG